MPSNTRVWIVLACTSSLLALAGCGGATASPGGGTGLEVATITSPFQAPVSSAFEITGGRYASLAGTDALVIFQASTGTPFADGTSATAEVPGTVTSDTTISGSSPTTSFAGDWTATVTVVLASGVRGASASPLAEFNGVPPVPPTAVDDAYDIAGNARLSRDAATGVLDNDLPPVGITVTSFDAASASGGQVDVQPDGSFTYDPPRLFNGMDTFTYEITNSFGTDTATVTITVTDMIWFLDSSAAPAGDGRQASPYNSVATFMGIQGGDALPGHWIFLFYGGGALYTDALTLLDDQMLIGQGVELFVGGETIVPSSSKPRLDVPAGDALTLAANNTVRGLTLASANGTALLGAAPGNLSVDTADAISTGGPAVNITGGTLDVALDLATASASPGDGILLQAADGTFSTAGTTITDASGAGIRLDNNLGTFTFAGTTIVGTTGRGIHATNGGTLNVTGAGNTITTTTGTALEVDTVNIGTSGLTFESITTNGATNGILLDSTGTSGGLTVTGDMTGAANGSGGAIDNSTSTGISLANCQDVSISQLDVDTSALHAITLTSVLNFTFQDAEILGGGAGNDQHAIDITNGHGAFLIEDVLFNDMNEDGIQIVNTLNDDATRDDFTCRRLIFLDHTPAGWGEHCIDVSAQGTSEFDALIDDCTFDVSFDGSLGVNCRSINSGDVEVTIRDCTFDSGDAFGSGSVQCVAADTSAATWNVLDNDMNASPFTAVLINNDDSATSFATVRGNDIDFNVATHNGFGISMRQDEEGVHTALIDDNTVDGHAFDPFRLTARDSLTGTGTLNATLTNNAAPTAATIFGAGCFCDSRDDNVLWLNATGNNLRGTRTFSSYDDDFAMRQDDTADLKVTQLDPTGAADPNRLDTINNSATNGTNGTILWNQGAPPVPPPVP